MLNNELVTIIPIKVPNMILNEAILVINKITAAIEIAITEVSPTDPGIFPAKASNQLYLSFNPGTPDSAAIPSGVAPE